MSDPVDFDALRQQIMMTLAGPGSPGLNVISGMIAGSQCPLNLGLAGVVAGHPFDTVKVRLQTIQKGGTTVKTFANIIKNERVFSCFYHVDHWIIQRNGITSNWRGTHQCSALRGLWTLDRMAKETIWRKSWSF